MGRRCKTLQQGDWRFCSRITFQKALLLSVSFMTPARGSKAGLQVRHRKTLVQGAWLWDRRAARQHTVGFLPRRAGPECHGLVTGLRATVCTSAQANDGAILTSQKSPAPSAVRKENRVRQGTRNSAGSQDLSMSDWQGECHVGNLWDKAFCFCFNRGSSHSSPCTLGMDHLDYWLPYPGASCGSLTGPHIYQLLATPADCQLWDGWDAY